MHSVHFKLGSIAGPYSPRPSFTERACCQEISVATFNKGNSSVGIVGLNTAYLNDVLLNSQNSRELILKQVRADMVGNAREWARSHSVILLLTRRPSTLLNPKILAGIRDELTPSSGLLMHLCGGNDSSLRESLPSIIQAPSLFGFPHDEFKVSGRLGYIAGRLDLTRPKEGLKLIPRVLSSVSGSLVMGPDEGCNPDGTAILDVQSAPTQREAASEPGTDASLLESMLGGLGPQRRRPLVADLRASWQEQPTRKPPSGVKLRGTLGTSDTQVNCLAWSPSEDALALGLSNGHIAYWETGKDTPSWVRRAVESSILDLCFSPDGKALASRSQHNVRVWTMEGEPLTMFNSIESRGSMMAWSPTGLLAVDLEGSFLQLWDTRTWKDGDLCAWQTNMISCLAWSSDGQILACGGRGDDALEFFHVDESSASKLVPMDGLLGHHVDVLDIAWMPGKVQLALACRDGVIYIVEPQGGAPAIHLEAHTGAVTCVAFSFDGRLLASKSIDGTLRLFRTDTWEQVTQIEVPSSARSLHVGLAFSPREHVLAVPGPEGHGVLLWELDIATLLSAPSPSSTLHEVSAKVVLMGEGRAGKSCLALRMVKDQYEELDSTHGMRFWSLPVEPVTEQGPRREMVLWDLGGQSEYQLVHQLFLRDSTVALMVMEPGRGDRALEEIEGWDRRLRTQFGEKPIRKLLVGTKVDHPESPVNHSALKELEQRLGFDPYVLTSAKGGHGIPELKTALAAAVDWEKLEKVSRPELFQAIRQIIQRLREAKRVVLSFAELESELKRELGDAFEPDSLRAVVSHLTRQGRVADTRMAGGTRMLILEVEQIERYAGSLIVAARENPHGVPAVELAKILSPKMKFPRIKDEERLTEDQEWAVLQCVIELLIEHGVCLRHEGLLIFPSLFHPTFETGADFSHAISLNYDFFGPIDNIYASLITSLAISQRFGAMRLWENRAEFGQAGKDSSGVRRVQSKSQGARGNARLDVYFDSETDSRTRDLFVNFIEQHLREHGVELLERLSVTCSCGKLFSEETVRARLTLGASDIGCEVCDRRTPLTMGAQQSRGRDPELAKQIQVLRTNIQEQRSQSVVETKVTMTESKKLDMSQSRPLRILHLSDLHVGADADPLSLLEPLAADLRDRTDGLGVERLDYLVLSGDITQRATPEEFKKAREFVSGLIEQFELSAERCILVPGNHDLDWNTEVYEWRKKRQTQKSQLVPDRFIEQGDGYLIRNEEKYPERFKNFSEHFYHPLLQKAYPLKPEAQCIPFLFSESRLQLLAMNSAWEIDEYFRERSSLSDKALTQGLITARQDIAEARKRGDLAPDSEILRLAVWHHPITGNEKIQDDAFMGRLAQADIRVCLHGHVHEDRADLVHPLHPVRNIRVVGAGSFGAPMHDRPESVPRLFNLMEVQRDLRNIRVHTRCLRKQSGAWEGWAAWPGERSGEKRTYYDIPVTPGRV